MGTEVLAQLLLIVAESVFAHEKLLVHGPTRRPAVRLI